jgi:hypothetical protein
VGRVPAGVGADSAGVRPGGAGPMTATVPRETGPGRSLRSGAAAGPIARSAIASYPRAHAPSPRHAAILRPRTGVGTAWVATTAGLAAWYGTWGAVAATVRWPGLTLILSGSAYLAHRTTTRVPRTIRK